MKKNIKINQLINVINRSIFNIGDISVDKNGLDNLKKYLNDILLELSSKFDNIKNPEIELSANTSNSKNIHIVVNILINDQESSLIFNI